MSQPADKLRPVPFATRVYDLVAMIPRGCVMTYGGIASELGAPRHARQVGRALARCPDECDIPAHRVLKSDGRLSRGYSGGRPDLQRALLDDEGITFTADGSIDLARHLWWPSPGASLEEPLR
jgi:methylated-DNA-protein-cysteine methyltransferase-like protein